MTKTRPRSEKQRSPRNLASNNRTAAAEAASPTSHRHQEDAQQQRHPHHHYTVGEFTEHMLEHTLPAADDGLAHPASPKEARLRRQAQLEVLSDLKGEVLARQASQGRRGGLPAAWDQGALGEYACTVAAEAGSTTPGKVVESVKPAAVDLEALDQGHHF